MAPVNGPTNLPKLNANQYRHIFPWEIKIWRSSHQHVISLTGVKHFRMTCYCSNSTSTWIIEAFLCVEQITNFYLKRGCGLLMSLMWTIRQFALGKSLCRGNGYSLSFDGIISTLIWSNWNWRYTSWPPTVAFIHMTLQLWFINVLDRYYLLPTIHI